VTEPTCPKAAEFQALYVNYGVVLRGIATQRYRIPAGDAEALVHDAFIAYLQRHTVVREVKPWLIGAVGNACKQYRRVLKREARATRKI
jgi:DNA-directed RNA polymerase specialized sigma24 family protein